MKNNAPFLLTKGVNDDGTLILSPINEATALSVLETELHCQVSISKRARGGFLAYVC